MVRRMVTAVLVVLIAGTFGFAQAADDDEKEYRVISDRLYYTLGGYLVDFSTEAAIGSGTLAGALIRLEGDFGVEEDKQTFRFDGFLRFGDGTKNKNAIDFGYMGIDRNGQTILDEDFEFQDKIYSIGAEINSKLNIKWFRLGWRRTLFHTERGEAGISVGLSTYRLGLGVAGQATLQDEDGNQIGTTFAPSGEDIIAPIPTVGMFIVYDFLPNLTFAARADYLNVEIGDITARLVDTRITADYFFTKNIGIGGGFNTTELEYKNLGDNPVTVSYRQSGFLFYLSLAF